MDYEPADLDHSNERHQRCAAHRRRPTAARRQRPRNPDSVLGPSARGNAHSVTDTAPGLAPRASEHCASTEVMAHVGVESVIVELSHSNRGITDETLIEWVRGRWGHGSLHRPVTTPATHNHLRPVVVPDA
ncbi:hypothetical protein GCM10009682_23780 [Luedemannella flava]|uniref:Uncharacterized protein n=1 Tax=Luedemannella flava TaxID=349316 RepID=A0ABP4Y816_9ACTN